MLDKHTHQIDTSTVIAIANDIKLEKLTIETVTNIRMFTLHYHIRRYKLRKTFVS